MTNIQQPFDFNMPTLKGITNELEDDLFEILGGDNDLVDLQFDNTLESFDYAFLETLKECNGTESSVDQKNIGYSMLDNKLFDPIQENTMSDMEMKESDRSFYPIVIQPAMYQYPPAAVQSADYILPQHQIIHRQNFHSEMMHPCVSQAIRKRSQYGGLYAMAYRRLQEQEQRSKQLISNPHLTQSSLSNMYPQRTPQSSNLLYSHDVPGILGNNNLYSIQNNCLVPVSLGNVLQQQTQVSDNHRPIQPASPTPTTLIENKPKIKPKGKVTLLPALEYRDLSMMTDEEAVADIKYTNMRGRSQVPFPVRLHLILERSEIDGYSSIISWMPHGRAFKIHNYALFLDIVMPRFFFQTKMSSFTRQLGMYGFHKLIWSKNVDKGAFFHELFLRERSGLAKGINRQSTRRLLDKKNEPNLYLFKSMPFRTIASDRTTNNYSSNELETDSTTNSRKCCGPRVIRYSETNSSDGNPFILDVPPIETTNEDYENSTPEAIKSFPISQCFTDGSLLPLRTQKHELVEPQDTNSLEKATLLKKKVTSIKYVLRLPL